MITPEQLRKRIEDLQKMDVEALVAEYEACPTCDNCSVMDEIIDRLTCDKRCIMNIIVDRLNSIEHKLEALRRFAVYGYSGELQSQLDAAFNCGKGVSNEHYPFANGGAHAAASTAEHARDQATESAGATEATVFYLGTAPGLQHTHERGDTPGDAPSDAGDNCMNERIFEAVPSLVQDLRIVGAKSKNPEFDLATLAAECIERLEARIAYLSQDALERELIEFVQGLGRAGCSIIVSDMYQPGIDAAKAIREGINELIDERRVRDTDDA